MNNITIDGNPKREIGSIYEHNGRQFRIVSIIVPKCPFCPDGLEVVFLDNNSRGFIDNSSLIREVKTP